MKRALRWIGIILLLLALLAGLAYFVADSEWGHRKIVEKIKEQRPKSGLRVEIGKIEGSIYDKASISDLRLSDPQGMFFETPKASLDWNPFAWWNNRLEIGALVAESATLHRLSKLRPSDEKKPILPEFDIEIRRFEIGKISIMPGVAGDRRVGRVKGSLIAKAGKALINLEADAEQGDTIKLKLDAEPDRNRFDVDAQISAPVGGVFARMIGTNQALRSEIRGDGSWQRWKGQGWLTLGAARIADLNLSNDEGRFGLNGDLSLQSITKGKVQRLVGTTTQVRGEASLANRRLDGSFSAVSDAISAEAAGMLDLGSNEFRGMNVEALLLKPPVLFPNMTGRDIRLKARLDGSFARARYEYLLTSPQVAFDQTGFEQVRAAGQGTFSSSPLMVPIRLTASRVTGVGDVAGGLLANLSVEGILQISPATITGDGLIVRSDKLSGKLGLFVDLKTGVYDVGLQGQLQRYEIPGLGIVDVKSELKVVPSGEGRGSRVIGRGQAWVRRLDNPFLASLAGGLPVLDTGLTRGPDGVLQLTGLKLSAPQLSLTGNGVRRRDGTFYLEGSGQQGRYGPFQLKLDGRIDRPKLDILLARPEDSLGLANVRLLLDPSESGYAWRAQGRSTLGAFTGNGQLILPRGSAAVIEIAQLDVSGMKTSGRLQSVNGGFAGKLVLNGGGVSGTLGLLPSNAGLQRIEAHLKARDARFEGPPLILAKRAQFDGFIIIDPAGTTIDGTVVAQGISRGAISLARLAANVKLRNGKGEIKAAFAGSRGRSFDLQTIAQVSQNRWQVVGGGTIDRRPVSLTTAAIATRTPEGWLLAPTELSYASGKARVAGLFGGSASEFDANLIQMPLAITDILSPGLGLGGIANGTIAYRLPQSGQPTGKVDLKIKGLTRSGLVLSSLPIDMGIAANLSGGVAGIRAIAVAGGREIGRGQARLQPTSSGTLYDRFANAAVFGQIRYSGSADALWRLSGVETLDVSGPIALGADLTGRVSDPIIRGSLTTSNARIESPATGMLLTSVNANVRFGEGSKMLINSITANAGKDGRVTGSGFVDLSAARGFAINLALEANNAALISRDDLAATVTGPIRIASDGSEGVISGEVLLNRSRFRLGRVQTAQALPKLNVREINGAADEVQAARPVMPWRLAIKARAPGRLAVTGLGIESEWRADLDIGGSPFSPVLRGRADLLRGDYDFAGRRFNLARGTIRFGGENPPDPALDILAEGDTQGLTASIRVTGTGQKPEIRFASVPSLPEDELLSRLLFGTSITNLSAPEAVQLASAVASLRNGGNGLNPINALRNAIGLDRLRILPADTVTGARTSVAAGKYLSRRAYVEIVTDGQGYSATRAEFQVTRWLSLLSSISTIGRQSAAVRVTKDY